MRFALHGVLLTLGFMTLAYMVTPALADEWDKQTTFRFNQPVEVPGHVLMPGTYVFKLADSASDRDVVQIFSQDPKGMDHLVTTVLAIPAYRVETPDKTIMTFEERRSNNPEAVRKWFYPGDNFGWQFVYPKAASFQVASTATPPPAAPAPEPAIVPPPASQAAAAAPAPVQPQQSVIAQNQPPATASATLPRSSSESSANRELPQTASDFPLVGMLGILFLAAGCLLVFGCKHTSV